MRSGPGFKPAVGRFAGRFRRQWKPAALRESLGGAARWIQRGRLDLGRYGSRGTVRNPWS